MGGAHTAKTGLEPDIEEIRADGPSDDQETAGRHRQLLEYHRSFRMSDAEHSDRALLYRKRADELKAIIPDMNDRIYAKVLEKIAADYDQLAETEERISPH